MTHMPVQRPPRHYRAIWISDVHLGARGCQAAMLLDFLRETESDTLYLVGDIVDGWRLKRWWYWPQTHNDVVQKLLRKARKGANVIYIPGNHDAFARRYIGYRFGGVEVLRETVHETADGRRLLVMHGDEFDVVVRCARWLAYLGDTAYHAALRLNVLVNWARSAFDLPYWSLSAYAKQRVKQAVKYIGAYEEAVAQAARSRGVDGCRLRPHPPRRDARHGRRALLQRRRLDGDLLRPGRASRRPAGDRALVRRRAGQAAAAVRRLDPLPRRPPGAGHRLRPRQPCASCSPATPGPRR